MTMDKEYREFLEAQQSFHHSLRDSLVQAREKLTALDQRARDTKGYLDSKATNEVLDALILVGDVIRRLN